MPPSAAMAASAPTSTRRGRRRRRLVGPALVVLVAVVALVGTVACTRSRGSEKAYCAEAKRTPDVLSLLTGFDASDPDALRVRFAAGNAAFRDLERAAPRKIRPDVARLGDVVEKILTAVEDNPGDLVKVRDELTALGDQAAGTARSALRVIDYTKRTCGIDLQKESGVAFTGVGGTTTTTLPPTGVIPTTPRPTTTGPTTTQPN